MTISSLSQSQSYMASLQTQYKKDKTDFAALQTAMQSGNLGAAQKAFAAVTSDLQQASAGNAAAATGSASGPGAAAQKLLQDPNFQNLQNALQSGDMDAAQTAFNGLQQDIQSASLADAQGASGVKGHRHHHHHHGVGNDPDDTAAVDPNDPDAEQKETENLLNILV
jgi:hypothetical protein